MKAPRRIFTADHIAQGVGMVTELQQEALKVAPNMSGPMSRVPLAVPMADETETLEGHCLTCKGKQQFQVEGEQKMKNGAIRKYGKCGSGHTMSHFVSGVTDAS
jgi:hypothetical protein